MRISLILPAYNESSGICETIAQAARYFSSRNQAFEIVVAADGDDGTRERAAACATSGCPVRVIGGPGRRGKGRAVREAVAVSEGDVIGYADADNKVPIQELDRLMPYLRDGVDAVTGSRALGGSRIERHQPLYRRIGSKGFHYFMQSVVGLPGITDTQCGFKFFQREVARDLFSRQKIDGYMFDVEILALARRRGYRVQEVPICWRDDGDSRLDLVSGNLRNVIDIFRIGFSL